jgi:hypothetical protein
MQRKRMNPSKLRPAEDVAQAMKSLAEWTGWSEQVCLNFLARSGWDALSGRLEKVSDYRSVMTAAREHHEAEVTSKRKLSVTAAKLREARRQLDAVPVAQTASARKTRTKKKPFTTRSHHAPPESRSESKSAR